MVDRSTLDAAASAGVISPEQVGPLHDFLSGRHAASPRTALGGEEDLRFIRNFHDVFLAIGIVLLGVGLAVAIGSYVASTFQGATENDARAVVTTIGALTAGAAAIMWGLGEVFARRRRLFLPAIAIVLALTMYAVVAAACLYFGLVLGENVDLGQRLDEGAGMPVLVRTGILLAASMAFVAPLLFYARFRLPFSLGLAGFGAACFVVLTAMTFSAEQTLEYIAALFLVLGVLLFLAGVAFDARDPARNSRFSDNGFWLHMAAAPFILNGALGLVSQLFNGTQAGAFSPSTGLIVGANAGSGVGPAAATLVVVGFLGLLSLLINRRALIVSALITTGVAIGVVLNALGLGAGALAASTLIALGALVLILGAGWHSVRRALLGWVKPDGVWARIFPPEPPAQARA